MYDCNRVYCQIKHTPSLVHVRARTLKSQRAVNGYEKSVMTRSQEKDPSHAMAVKVKKNVNVTINKLL